MGAVFLIVSETKAKKTPRSTYVNPNIITFLHILRVLSGTYDSRAAVRGRASRELRGWQGRQKCGLIPTAPKQDRQSVSSSSSQGQPQPTDRWTWL